MRNAFKIIGIITLALLQLSALGQAAEPPAPATATAAAPAVKVTQNDLQALQLRLDSLKQQISQANNYNQLEGPQDRLQALIVDIDRLSTALLPEQAQLRAQLEVLGPAQVDAPVASTSDIAAQRKALTEQKDSLDATLTTLATLKESATNLLTQIAGIRRTMLESELTLSTHSLLNPAFWLPVFNPLPDDRQRLQAFFAELGSTAGAVWQPGQRVSTVVLVLLALLVWTLGRRLVERWLAWACMNRVPEGRLRRSSLALASVLATLLATGVALELLFYACTRHLPLPAMLATFSEEFEKLAYTCVLITG